MEISQKYQIVHYCCNKYPDSFGGVPRYDYHISLVFPDRMWFSPSSKGDLLDYLGKNFRNNNIIVITDNHLACDIPNNYPVIIVHHGVVKTTIERTPILANNKMYKKNIGRAE